MRYFFHYDEDNKKGRVYQSLTMKHNNDFEISYAMYKEMVICNPYLQKAKTKEGQPAEPVIPSPLRAPTKHHFWNVEKQKWDIDDAYVGEARDILSEQLTKLFINILDRFKLEVRNQFKKDHGEDYDTYYSEILFKRSNQNKFSEQYPLLLFVDRLAEARGIDYLELENEIVNNMENDKFSPLRELDKLYTEFNEAIANPITLKTLSNTIEELEKAYKNGKGVRTGLRLDLLDLFNEAETLKSGKPVQEVEEDEIENQEVEEGEESPPPAFMDDQEKPANKRGRRRSA